MKNLRNLTLALLFATAIFLPGLANAQSWKSDQGHSSVLFSVRHIVTPFVGKFTTYEVTIDWNKEDPTQSKISGTLDPGSVDTGSESRDKHLRSADFFDVGSHSEWTFESKEVRKAEIEGKDNAYIAKGDLTAKGVTKEVEIPFEMMGEMETRGGIKSGVTGEFTIKRTDFGLGKAGAMLGDEVKIMAFLELNSQ